MRYKKISSFVYTGLSTYFSCILAGAIYAAAIKYFLFPSHVIMTGTEGIAISTAHFFGNKSLFIWLYVIFQSILIIFAFLKIGWHFAFKTLLVVGSVVGLLTILPEYQFARPQGERIILVIFGGILAGIAKAIAFRKGSSTGDEDIPAAYFSMKYLRPVGSIAIIAATFSTIYGVVLAFIKTQDLESVINTLMYTTIYIFMSASTLNSFYRKFKLVLVNVITKIPATVGDSIRKTLPHRTFTKGQGVGGYSKDNVKILRVIVTQEEIPDIMQAIKESDENAFFFYHDIEGVSKHYYISPIK